MSNIDFEQDQEKLLNKTGNIQSLADQVEKLDNLAKEIEAAEDVLKQRKKNYDYLWPKDRYRRLRRQSSCSVFNERTKETIAQENSY